MTSHQKAQQAVNGYLAEPAGRSIVDIVAELLDKETGDLRAQVSRLTRELEEANEDADFYHNQVKQQSAGPRNPSELARLEEEKIQRIATAVVRAVINSQ